MAVTTNYLVTGNGITGSTANAVQALVSGAWSRRGNAPFLVKRKATLLSGWGGKVKSVANAADYCTRVFKPLECHTDRARVGIINCVAADLVNVRVSLGTSDTMPADLASLHGSTTTSGAILSNGALATGSAFTVLAGTSVTKPKITWSEWLDIRTVDRADGGTLPAVRVTIEIPTAGNPNRPAYDTATTRSGWESQGDLDTAPYGRCYKARNGASLGVTTPGSGSSTTWSDETIPFIIEYVPRGGTVGLTLCLFGDSTSEGTGADITGHGWLEEARALLSTMAAPVEVCNLAMASATLADVGDRIDAVASDLNAELAILQMFSSNGITAPNFTEASTAPTQRRATQRARAALAAAGTAVIGTPGIPLSASFKDLDAASAAVLNTHIAAIRGAAGSMPVIDTYGPMMGTTDADGQVSALSSAMADGAHPNTVGHRDLIAPKVVETLAQLLMS